MTGKGVHKGTQDGCLWRLKKSEKALDVGVWLLHGPLTNLDAAAYNIPLRMLLEYIVYWDRVSGYTLLGDGLKLIPKHAYTFC